MYFFDAILTTSRFLALLPYVFAVCKSPWFTYGNSCYYYHNVTSSSSGFTYNDSLFICRIYGGNLASILNKNESKFISSIFRDPLVKEKQQYWIGLNDISVEGKFEWSDGSTYNKPLFHNWLKYHDLNNKDKDCVQMSGDGAWNVVKCYLTLGFVCKRSIVPTDVPVPPTSLPRVPPSTLTCEVGWKPWGTSCYGIIHSTVRTWKDARNDCVRRFADLIIIETTEELNYITNVLDKQESGYWIGLSDVHAEGKFFWVNEKPLNSSVANWQQDAPNNAYGNENCVEMHGKLLAGKWNDDYCKSVKSYICEKQAGKHNCPQDWVAHEDYCYQINVHPSQKLTWENARASCLSFNEAWKDRVNVAHADLVSIHTEQEQKMLHRDLMNIEGLDGNGFFWTGLKKKDGTWSWSDNSIMKHQAWQRSSSKNLVGPTCGKASITDDRGWVQSPCSEKQNYICKVKRGHGRCYDPLGMQNFEIPDAAITSSDELLSSTPPSAGRLHMQPRKATGGAWCANQVSGDGFGWIQVNFGIPQKVTYMAVQGNASSEARVTLFKLYYSQDGKSWDSYNPGVKFSVHKQNNSDLNEVSIFKIDHILVAQYIQVYPLRCHVACCMRMEFYGCKHEVENAKCGLGWKEDEKAGHCYKFSAQRASWDDAAGYCKNHGGDLLSITSYQEKNFIKKQLKLMSGRYSDYWIGLNDLDKIGIFRWIDESPLVFSNFILINPVKNNVMPYRLHKKCWVECGKVGGRCSFCGDNGYCCSKFRLDCPQKLRNYGGSSTYTCVRGPTKRAHTCAYIHTVDGEWRNTHCGKWKPYICKRSYKHRVKDNVNFTDNWRREAAYYWPLNKVTNGTSIGTVVVHAFGNFANSSIFPIPYDKNDERKVLLFDGKENYLVIPNLDRTCLSNPDSFSCIHGLTISFLFCYDENTSSKEYILDTMNEHGEYIVGYSVYVIFRTIYVYVHGDGHFYFTYTNFNQTYWNHFAFSWSTLDGLTLFINGTQRSRDISGSKKPSFRRKEFKITTLYIGISRDSFTKMKLTSLAVFERVLRTPNIQKLFRFEFGECERWQTAHGLYCYEISKIKATGYKATRHCLINGGNLMSIHSTIEQAFLTSYLRKHKFNLLIGMLGSKTWSDGTDVTYSNLADYSFSPYNKLVYVSKHGYWKHARYHNQYLHFTCKYERGIPLPEGIIRFPSQMMIKKGQLLTTLEYLGKEYSISFQFFPTKPAVSTATSVIRFITNNWSGTRIPGIYYSANRLRVCLNGESTLLKCYQSRWPNVKVNQWTDVNVTQTRAGVSYDCQIFINGRKEISISNSKASQFRNVKVFLSEKWRISQPGFIRNLEIKAVLHTDPGKDDIVKQEIILGGTSWGEWSKYIRCTYGARVIGFRLQVQSIFVGDNTALNGIQLACSDGTLSEEIPGLFGTWREWVYCADPANQTDSAYVTGFKLRSQGKTNGDNTAANNVMMKCKNKKEIDGGGTDKGVWSDGYKECSSDTHLCGLQASMDTDNQIDNTALNEIRFLCCANFPNKEVCPPGYSMYGEFTCFVLHQEELSFIEAAKQCDSDGASLAAIESSDEEIFMVSMMARLYKKNDIWIGMEYNAESQIYSWIDGRPVLYTNWYNREPDPRNGKYVKASVRQGAESYLFWRSAGKMERHPFFCRKLQVQTTKEPYINATIQTTEEPSLNSANSSDACPEGWVKRNHYCYMHNKKELSHESASSSCSNFGGQLASITSMEENDFIFKFLQNSTSFGIAAWLGLTNQAIQKGYYWLDDKPVTFVNWNTNSPYTGLRHFCVGMNSGGRWWDLPCYSRHQSVCKILVGKQSSKTCTMEDGPCVNRYGKEDNAGVIKLNIPHGNEQCLQKCLAYPGATGCQLKWDRSRRSQGCYVHTREVRVGYTLYGSSCWILSKCKAPSSTVSPKKEVSPQYEYGKEIFAHPGELDIKEQKLLPTLNYLTDEYMLSFEIKPSRFAVGKAGVIQLLAEDNIQGKEANISIFYFYKASLGSIVEACSDVTPNLHRCVNITSNNFLINKWTTVNISQTYSSSLDSIYQMWIDDSLFLRLSYKDPSEYTNVTVYVGNSLFAHQPGLIQNILIKDLKSCPTGWRFYNKKCYYFSSRKVNYYEANQQCKDMDSYLTSIHSAQENKYLRDEINKKYSPRPFRVLIGMNDMSTEGEWQWVDGTIIQYVNYNGKEPNDHRGGEDCMEMKVNGKWNDIPCNLDAHYICKKHDNVDVDMKSPSPSPTPSDENGVCDSGWHIFGSKCYQFHLHERKTYIDALEYCRRFTNGNLVSIHSSNENAFILSHMQATHGSVYIGLRESTVAGDLYWSDQSILDYAYWYRRKSIGKRNVLVCAAVIPSNGGRWDIIPCWYATKFVCQKDTSKVPSSSAAKATPQPICPDKYTTYSGDCYKVVSTPKTWKEAAEVCQQIPKGNLVSYHDIFTQAFVFSRLMKNTKSWIGLNKQNGDVDIHWSDNTPLNFQFWKNAQIPTAPDGSDICISEGYSEQFDGVWEGNNCSLRLPFTCKISLKETPISTSFIGNCSAGWEKFGRLCYKHFFTSVYARLTWSQARKSCQRFGGELVTIDSKELFLFVAKVMERSTRWFKETWIGLNDRHKEQIWQWSSGKPFTAKGFTNWKVGEPNDVNGNENCVELDSRNFKWNDVDCSRKFTYFCEHPLECRSVLGMESKEIPDNSITATSYADNYYPRNARLNARFGPQHTSWCANDTDEQPSLTINLGEEMEITLIQLQGLPNKIVYTYNLNYSMDGKMWLAYSENTELSQEPRVFPGNDPTKALKSVGSSVNLRAVYLRFMPIHFKNLACMKVELFGCKSVCSRALGMASHAIPNNRLSASSSDPLHPIEHGRPTYASGWCAKLGDVNPWYQIDLGHEMRISRIMLSGSGFRDYIILFNGAKSRMIPYTGYDGYTIRIFPINPTIHDLEYPQISRYVAFRPNTLLSIVRYCLQVELYGCEYECDNSLGMESSQLPNSLIKASSQLRTYPSYEARLNQGTFNKNSWCAAINDNSQYLQIHFTNTARITHIATQGFYGNVTKYVKTYNFQWSSDGDFYHQMKEELFGNNNGVDVNKVKLKEPVLARFIRLNPTSFKVAICMRVEIYGCFLNLNAARAYQTNAEGLSSGGKIGIIVFFLILLITLIIIGIMYYKKQNGGVLFRARIPFRIVIEMKDDNINIIDDQDDNQCDDANLL